jgi:hypothetical protein
MLTIWKYTLEIGTNVLEVPSFAEPLHVAPQQNTICIWFLVLDQCEKVDRPIDVYGTGHPIPEFQTARNHIGTVQMGDFVWHVFERRRP